MEIKIFALFICKCPKSRVTNHCCSFHFRQVKFHGSSLGGVKRVAEEEIIEVEDLAAKQSKPNFLVENDKKPSQPSSIGLFRKPQTVRPGLGAKSSLAYLVKRKPVAATSTTTSAAATNNINVSTMETTTKKTPSLSTQPATSTTNALSLLGGYDSNSDSDASD